MTGTQNTSYMYLRGRESLNTQHIINRKKRLALGLGYTVYYTEESLRGCICTQSTPFGITNRVDDVG